MDPDQEEDKEARNRQLYDKVGLLLVNSSVFTGIFRN